MIAGGFGLTILVGALLLILPASSAEGVWTGFLDALFTSTSAVCVTGLIVVDTAVYWSPFGKVVILLLIQVGGLGIMLFAALIGLAIGWVIYSRDATTQRERDRFEIPVLYPLLRHKLYVDDLALGISRGTQGPVARFVDWTNTYVIDSIVNMVGLGVKRLGTFVYAILDQRGVDGFFNGLSAVTDSAGSALRKLQTGRVQQYATAFVVGALVLVVVFVIVV